jgi:hypothetical protein
VDGHPEPSSAHDVSAGSRQDSAKGDAKTGAKKKASGNKPRRVVALKPDVTVDPPRASGPRPVPTPLKAAGGLSDIVLAQRR